MLYMDTEFIHLVHCLGGGDIIFMTPFEKMGHIVLHLSGSLSVDLLVSWSVHRPSFCLLNIF